MENLKDYINNLKSDKQKLVNNLVGKGIEASNDETFTTLVAKVAGIHSGDSSEYFNLVPGRVTDGGHSFLDLIVKKLPLFDTSNVTNFDYGFSNLYLQEFPQIDTSNGTSFRYMFYGCISAKNIPNLDISNGTNFSHMFDDCREVRTIQGLDTSKGTIFDSMFRAMTILITLGLLDMGSAIDIRNMFYYDSYLQHVEGFKDLGKAYDTTKSANYNYYTLDLSSCSRLTHDSIMNIINNVYDIASLGCQPQKIKVHANTLALLSEEEVAIATNKGWTVATS